MFIKPLPLRLVSRHLSPFGVQPGKQEKLSKYPQKLVKLVGIIPHFAGTCPALDFSAESEQIARKYSSSSDLYAGRLCFHFFGLVLLDLESLYESRPDSTREIRMVTASRKATIVSMVGVPASPQGCIAH